MDFLTVPGLLKKYNEHKENLELTSNPEPTSNPEHLDYGFITAIFTSVLIIYIGLYVWAFILLMTIKVPPIILVLCVIFSFMGLPYLSIILSYSFKDKTINLN
jgi:hypothetical protein